MAAAGNSASDPCPFYYNEATTFAKILVGATDRNDAAAGFSNYGPCVPSISIGLQLVMNIYGISRLLLYKSNKHIRYVTILHGDMNKRS